jgi:hypothetical protein
MNPENTNDNMQPESAEYLNEIAPVSKKAKASFLWNKPILIGGILLAVTVFVILAMLASNLSSAGTKPMKTLSARLTTTAKTVTLAHKNNKNTKLRALNSSLNIYLSNTNRDFVEILTLNKIQAKSIDKSILTAESNTKMLANLEDARLNAVYDRVYVIEMNTQLEKILLLMRQINSSTKSTKTKTFLDSAIKNLEPIQKQFEDYNSPVS